MKRESWLLLGVIVVLPLGTGAQEYRESGSVRVAVVRNPFGASESILEEGLIDRLTDLGCEIGLNETFVLTQEERTYRGWARDALISRHLADLISSNGKKSMMSRRISTTALKQKSKRWIKNSKS